MPRTPLLRESRGQRCENKARSGEELQHGHEPKGGFSIERVHGLPDDIRHGHGEQDVIALHLVHGRFDYPRGGQRDVYDPLCSRVDAARCDEGHKQRRPEQHVGNVWEQNRNRGGDRRCAREEAERPSMLTPLVRADEGPRHGDAPTQCGAYQGNGDECVHRKVQRVAKLPHGVIADHVLRPTQEAELRAQGGVGGPIHTPSLGHGILDFTFSNVVLVAPWGTVRTFGSVVSTCRHVVHEGLRLVI
mmetsp:Transcript_51102/g.100953  ORF Transcript_51102/g.100953 Transcript_51102/m.100953 type:complete len:246 (+) Transcript_51102:196-933(+)